MTTSIRSGGFRRRRNALLVIGAAVPLIALWTVTLPSFAADLVSVDWRVSGSGEETAKIQGVIVEVAGQRSYAGGSGVAAAHDGHRDDEEPAVTPAK